MEPNSIEQRKRLIYKLMNERLVDEGGMQRTLMGVMEDQVRMRLEESGWNDQMKALATNVARSQGVHNATKDSVLQEVRQ